MLAAAQTGTGKTAAYSLPIIQKIAESGVRAKPKEVTALILAPTRELAAQIHENITAYSKYLDIRSALVFGGVNLKPRRRYSYRHAGPPSGSSRSEACVALRGEVPGAR